MDATNIDSTIFSMREIDAAYRASELTGQAISVFRFSPYENLTLKQLQAAYRDRGRQPGKLCKRVLFALLDSLPRVPETRKRRKDGKRKAA